MSAPLISGKPDLAYIGWTQVGGLAGIGLAVGGFVVDWDLGVALGLAVAVVAGIWGIVLCRGGAGDKGAVPALADDPVGERRRGLRRDADGLMRILDQAPVGVLVTGDDGVLRFVNSTFAEWLGRPPAELVSGTVHLHDLMAHPPTGGRPFDLLAAGGSRQTAAVAWKNAARPELATVCDLEVVRELNGAVTFVRATVRDVSGELAWRRALEQSNRRLRRLFESAPIGIALLDADRRLLECNGTFAAMAGQVSANALNGRALGDVVVERDRGLVQRPLPISAADAVRPLEVQLSGDGQRVVQLFIRPLSGAVEHGKAEDPEVDGSGALALVYAIDLTERRSLEAQFVQSQKMQAVGQLAGGVAHDFNNLLTAMIGFCDLLLLRHKPGDHSFNDVMQIKQNANRAANLVRQLLAFSRQQTLQPRVLDVTDVLAELANLLRRLIGETIELRLIHGRDLGLIKVDQNQLEQVIVNLVVNARDAMPGGGRLTLVTSNLMLDHATPTANQQEEIPAGDYVCVEVIDTGVGIPQENLARIFEPFFSTKAIGAGTGLGLSTVYGIVRQTGGFISVESVPGEGARFTILLPRHAGESPEPAVIEARDGVGADLTGSATVLLVEDEDAVRVFSARALRNKGYDVIEAKNGEAAMGMLAEAGETIDLLVTDVVMPQMDGPTLARKARELLPSLKVIFISGYAEDRVREDLGGVEGSHFLPKPFSLKQLAAKVREVVRRG